MASDSPPIRTGDPVIRLGATLSLALALMMLYMPYQFQGGAHRYLYEWLRPLGGLFLVAFILQVLTLAELGLRGWQRMAGHLLHAMGMLVLIIAYYRAQGPLASVSYVLLLIAYLLAVVLPRWESGLLRALYAVLLMVNGGMVLAIRMLQAGTPLAIPPWVDPMFLVTGLVVAVGAWMSRRWAWTGWASMATVIIPVLWTVQANYQAQSWSGVALNGALLMGAVSESLYLRRPWRVTPAGLRRKILALTLTVAVLPTIGFGAYSVYNVQTEAHARALESLSLTASTLARQLEEIVVAHRLAPLTPEELSRRLQATLPSPEMRVLVEPWPETVTSLQQMSEALEESSPGGDRLLVARHRRPDLRMNLVLTQPAKIAYTKAASHAASLLVGSLVVTGLAVVAGTLLSSRLTRRLTTLREAIAAIAELRYDVGTIAGRPDGDEVDMVSLTLQRMAAALEATHEEIQSQNETLWAQQMRLQEETAQRESEHRRLSAVLQALPVGVFLADSAGQLYHINESGREIWGTAEPPLTGPAGWEMYRVRDPLTGRLQPLEERAMYRALCGEEGLRQEVAIDTFDGQRKILLQSAVPVRDADGKITDVVGTAVDITEQKRTEAAIRESEASREEKRAILEMVAVGAPLNEVLTAIARFTEKRVGGACVVFRVEEAGDYLRLAVAPSLPASLYPPGERLPVGHGVRVSGSAVARKEVVISEDIATDPDWREPSQRFLADGIRSAWSMPILNPQEVALGAITILYRETKRPSEADLRDVETATHMATIAIERERLEQGRGQKLQSLLQYMAEGVIAVDEHRRLLFVNPAARRLLGLSEMEETDRPWDELLPQPLAVSIDRIAAPGAYDPEKVAFTCNGRNLEAELSPVYSEFGRYGALAVIRDITEQIRFRRLQESFVANVSHELRGPLASISATLEAITDGVIPLDERPRYYRAILEEMARLRRLSFDVIDLTRLDSGVAQMKRQQVALNQLLESLVDRVSRRAAEAEVTLRVTCEPLVAAGDHDRVDQVITNLVDNAIRFTPPGGEISIEAALEGEMVRLTVRDTGIGIPQQHLPFIFERFYKVDAARTPRTGGGTGLGLAIARQLVELMGGTMEASSVEGVGTMISFTLPLS